MPSRPWVRTLGALLALTAGAQALVAQDHWPRWRGPLDTGVAPDADPPLTWSEEANVRWKVAVPGRGHSTPVVFGERLFLTTAIPVGEALPPQPETSPGAHDNAPVTHVQRYVALAYAREDGRLLWRRDLHDELPHEGAHVSASFASPSPVTDGKHLFAFFGSRGLYALDLEGELVWKTDLGNMRAKHGHGEGSSPALHDDTVVVNWDHEAQSFLVALDKTTGEERWRVQRDEITSWATPIVVEIEGRAQVVVPGSVKSRGHDLATGELIWECGGLSRNVVASPVVDGTRVFLGSSYEKQAMLGLELKGAKGELEGTDHLLWVRRRKTPYVPSPLLYGDSLYFLHHYQGVLSRVLTDTGREPARPYRLGLGNIYASPVAAAGRIYVTDLNGVTVVLAADDLRVLARNRLGDSFHASAALAEGDLYLRGLRHLYCVAAPTGESR